MALLKTDTKIHCPCCASSDRRWCYRFHALFYCVECLKEIYGRGPARLAREC
jgi:hypothetical protein